jgi:hypothetical protein
VIAVELDLHLRQRRAADRARRWGQLARAPYAQRRPAGHMRP